MQLLDPQGDAGHAFDITKATFTTVGDQFFVQLEFAQAFDPSRGLGGGPWGEVVFDTDQDILTGGLFMGDDIATWGGDIRLSYNFFGQTIGIAW
jgi:hypothetical protein